MKTTFNSLTFIRDAGIIKFKNCTKRLSLFKCVCGKEKVIVHSMVINGRTKSCGCMKSMFARTVLAPRNRKPYGESAFNVLLSSYKRSALKRKLNFNLTKEEFKILTSQLHQNRTRFNAVPYPDRNIYH